MFLFHVYFFNFRISNLNVNNDTEIDWNELANNWPRFVYFFSYVNKRKIQ